MAKCRSNKCNKHCYCCDEKITCLDTCYNPADSFDFENCLFYLDTNNIKTAYIEEENI